MSLRVKRCFKIDKDHRLELDKKGVGIDFGDSKLINVLSNYIKLGDEFDYDNDKTSLNVKNINSPEELENLLDEITSMHINCNEKINWNTLSQIKEPFEDENNGPKKQKAEEEFENYEPNFLEKTFKFLGKTKKKKLYEKIGLAQEEDRKTFEEYMKIKKFSNNILEGDIDSYFQLIDDLRPFNKLINYGSKIEFGTNHKDSIEIEFNANSKMVVPTIMYVEDNNGKLVKQKSDVASYYDNVQDYVCSATIMIAKKVMNLLPVDKVVVHAVDNVKEYKTGTYKDITILSVVFDRATLEKLNLKSMEPTFVLDNFICNMRNQKTSGFKSVDRITQY